MQRRRNEIFISSIARKQITHFFSLNIRDKFPSSIERNFAQYYSLR